MEELDSLILSSLDFEARKGCFKKELAELLNIPVSSIGEVKVASLKTDGLITQLLCIQLNNVLIPKEKLMTAPFNNVYLFEVYTPSLSLSSANFIIQSDDDESINAILKDEDGSLIENETVYFFEAYEPTSLSLNSDKSIIQTNDTATFTSVLKDEDGSRITNEIIILYKEE